MIKRILLSFVVALSSVMATFANSLNGDNPSKYSYYSCNIQVKDNTSFNYRPSNFPKIIYSFSIDGQISIEKEDYLVRVLLSDANGKEYLVMESYKEIRGNVPSQFEDYSEESFRLDGISIDSIKVYTRGVSLQIKGLRCLTEKESLEKNNSILTNYRKKQSLEDNVRRINEYNEKNRKLWYADVTWLSQQSYEVKKRVLGFNDNCSTRGIEYYAGGIVEIDEEEQYTRSHTRTSTSYVDEFDWRKRHGKNWLTTVKYQGHSNYCYFFTCVGAVEALTNLYYNQKIDLDLSEQELASCSNVLPNPYFNGTPSDQQELPLNYLKNHGVCDDDSYPFHDSPSYIYCYSESITPNELVSIDGYEEIDIIHNGEDGIKDALINHGPLVSGIRSVAWPINHAMVLVGFGKLQAGDTIYHHLGYNNGYYHHKYLTVEEDDSLIGRTYMVYKNSYDLNDNDSNQGYMYVIHNNYTTSMNRTFYLKPPITTMNYSSEDIVCEDADGDGYYYWGIGDKPSSCPSWVPDTPDGDDANYQFGPMDAYGNLEDLSLRALNTIHIFRDFTYLVNNFIYKNICVCSSSSLTIQSTINMYGNTNIKVEPNGVLIIDGGHLINADLNLYAGSKLIVKNGGTITMRSGKEFFAPLGAVVEIEEGMIE